MQERPDQKRIVSNDDLQPFPDQQYRMRWGKKQKEHRETVTVQNSTASLFERCPALALSLRVPTSRSPTQAVSADLRAKVQMHLQPLCRGRPDCRQRCRLIAG